MMIKEDIGYKEGNMDGFFNGANGLDEGAFERLFDDTVSSANGKQHSGATDFDFVNKMWNEAIENGQKKRRRRRSLDRRFSSEIHKNSSLQAV